MANITAMTCIVLARAVLFCAASNTTSLGPRKPYVFQQITAVRTSDYNLSTGYFTTQMKGTYIMHVSSAVPAGATLNLVIDGGGLNVNILFTTTNNDGWDTTSRDVIYYSTQATQILLDLKGGASASNSFLQTSWSAFLLDNVMSPVIAFCTSRSSKTTLLGKIDYTTTLVNAENSWNLAADTFTAPQSGIYVFSVSCGVLAGETYDLLISFSSGLTYEMINKDIVHNGIETVSRSFAVSLSAGDTVYTRLIDGYAYSDDSYQTSFAGFLYEPLNGRKVIWSVHQTNIMYGTYSPFPFNDVNVNIGNGWNSTANIFVAPYAGVYQLHLTATVYYSRIDFRLYWNNVTYANIYMNTTNYNGIITRSRAVMIDAAAGDTFFITTTSTTVLYSNSYRLISFTGFLISP